MRSFTYSIHIDRGPEVVWAYMMDFSKASRWRNLVRDVEPLTPGPLRPGSELKITIDVRGKVRTAVSEVWAFDPARRFGVRNTEENVTGTFEYILEPAANGTKVTFTCDVAPRGLMWLATPWLIKGNRLRYSEQLPRLKREVEKDAR